MKKCLLILLCLAAALVVCGCETEGTNGAEQSSAASDEFLGTYTDPATGCVVQEYASGALLQECPMEEKKLTLPTTYEKGEIVGVAANAFRQMETVTTLVIPDGYTTIGDSAFADCPKLYNLYVGKDVKEIGEWAFSGCTKLLTVEVSPENPYFYSVGNCILTRDTHKLVYSNGSIPAETKIIGFAACAKKIQTNWNLPEGLEKIEANAFYGGAIEALILPANVTEIGDNAFAGCEKLRRVYFPASVTKVGQNLFEGTSHGISLYCEAEKQPEGWALQWDAEAKAVNVSWAYVVSDPKKLLKRSKGNPIQNTHFTPENLSQHQDCVAYNRSGVSPVYIRVLDMELFFSVNEYGNVIYNRDADARAYRAGMKIWICTPDGEKIDYVYTNSDGMAKFECSAGEYLFLLERGEFEEQTSGLVKCAETFWSSNYDYMRYDTHPYVILAYRGERENFKVRIIDSETKEPIAGAEVEVQDKCVLTTDEEGYAVFPPLVRYADSWADSVFLVTCSAEGYDVRSGEYIQLYATELVMELEANIITEYTITVLDYKTGKPVEGIRVIEYGNRHHEDTKLFNNVTGEDGTIRGQFSSAELDGPIDKFAIRLEFVGDFVLQDGSVVTEKATGEVRMERGEKEHVIYLEIGVRFPSFTNKKR